MTRLMIAAAMMLSFQIAHAEEAPKPAHEKAAVESTQKSFFETRSLQDVQQLVNLDAQFASDFSAQAPGNG